MEGRLSWVEGLGEQYPIFVKVGVDGWVISTNLLRLGRQMRG